MEKPDLNGQQLLAGLTGKQRQVLDLLIEHKTTKEIARTLGISPHTVDQRIQFAKEKLGAANRSEAAVVYRRLRETWDQMTYKDSGIAESESDEESDDGANAPVSSPPLQKHSRSDSLEPAGADFQVVQGVFEGRFGTLMRLGAIAVIAVCLLLLVLGALATLLQLSHLLRG